MRSVYLRILVWFFGTLALSMIAFVMITRYVTYRSGGLGPSGPELVALIFEETIRAYESGGPQGLAERIDQLHRYFPGDHYLVDSQGRDLATGEDRSALLERIGSGWGDPKIFGGKFLVGVKSPDNRFRLIAVLPFPRDILPYVLFCILILLAVGMVCWALALSIASPLRNLSQAVDRFGRGDLSIRVNSRRRDEIGALGRSFDRMAQRIETLLISERRLLQDVSHELRSPLARLSFAVELVKKRNSHDDQKNEDGQNDAAVLRLKKEIDRLTHLVSALLEMTRAEADSDCCNREGIRLDVILKEVVEDCRLEAEARRCAIRLSGDRELTMRGNGELLRRAFENVLRNAIRYTAEGSFVEVELTENDGQATVVVRDYGPGVPEELLSKIFQPFFRVDGSRDSATGGVGLGLAIAKRAIDVHHGVLTAANADPGLRIEIDLSLESRQLRQESEERH